MLAVPLLVLVVGGCANGFSLRREVPVPDVPINVTVAPGDDVLRPQQRAVEATPHTAAALQPQGRTAEALDTTTAAERAAATTTPSAGGAALGQTLAGLGPPGEQGFWLRTGLVDRVRQGRVEAAGGSSVAVELRPSGSAPGSGSQISLSAMRALGVPLTQLVQLTVHATD